MAVSLRGIAACAPMEGNGVDSAPADEAAAPKPPPIPLHDDPTPERWAILALHRDRAVTAVRARGVRREDAEDCVHDALLQVMRHPALDHGRVAALITVVAMRRHYDRMRDGARQHRAAQRLGRFAGAAVSPAEVALDRLEAHTLAAHAMRLPLRQREALAWRAAGDGAAATARALGITAKAAESALWRARARLRVETAAASEQR